MVLPNIFPAGKGLGRNISIGSLNISWKNWFAAALVPRSGPAPIPLGSLTTIQAEAW